MQMGKKWEGPAGLENQNPKSWVLTIFISTGSDVYSKNLKLNSMFLLNFFLNSEIKYCHMNSMNYLN